MHSLFNPCRLKVWSRSSATASFLSSMGWLTCRAFSTGGTLRVLTFQNFGTIAWLFQEYTQPFWCWKRLKDLLFGKQHKTVQMRLHSVHNAGNVVVALVKSRGWLGTLYWRHSSGFLSGPQRFSRPILNAVPLLLSTMNILTLNLRTCCSTGVQTALGWSSALLAGTQRRS